MSLKNPQKPFLVFQSPTCGTLNFNASIERLVEYFRSDPAREYDLIIGTDSVSSSNGHVDFISAIVAHRKGNGGIYFWTRTPEIGVFSLHQRMYEEALLSIRLGEQVIKELQEREIVGFNLVIHVDIGTNGETKKLVQEIVGMVKGNGFSVMIKPDSFGASSVADRHT